MPQSGMKRHFVRALAFVRSAHMQILGPTGGYARPTDGDSTAAVYYAPTILSLPGYWLPQYGADILGSVIGFSWAFFLAWFMSGAQTVLIPQLTAPHPAWRFWFAFHSLGIWAFNHWMHLAYFAAPQLYPTAAGGSSPELRPLTGVTESPARTASPVPSSFSATAAGVSRSYSVLSAGWLVFWEVLTYVMMRRTFYPEFVVKMFVLFPLLAAIMIAALNLNRDVWYNIAKQQQHMQGPTATAHGGMSSILPGGGRR